MNHSMAQPPGAPARGGLGWQLILADLALILFLLTLSALPAAEAEKARGLAAHAVQEKTARGAVKAEVAAAQALYRPVPDGLAIGEWLASQAPDPRATLTIFAVHAPGGEATAWARAEALAAEARAGGTRVRMIISAGRSADLYASLAYDAPPAEDKAGDKNAS
jgi:hypothetical protein